MDDSLFISEQPVARTVEIAKKKHTLHFREVSDADWYRYIETRGSDDLDVRAGARAYLISRSLCEPDGTLALTLERAASIKLRAAKAIETAILTLDSDAREEAGKDSPPGEEIGSGTS